MTKTPNTNAFLVGTVLGFVLAALLLFVAGLAGFESKPEHLWPNVWFVSIFSLSIGLLSGLAWRKKK